MINKTLVLLLVILLTPIVYGYFIDEKIDSVAMKYKAYDEILSNITVVNYNNQTYYLVSYTRNLVYSGSVVLAGDGSPVTDPTINRAFFAAQLLHKSYPIESTTMYSSFSGHYAEISKSLPKDLSTDASSISNIMSECSSSMTEAITSFNPDAAGRYLDADDRLMAMMKLAEIRISQSNLTEDDQAFSEYQQSIYSIYPQLEASKKNMNSAIDYMTNNAEQKITGKNRETDIDLGINIVIVIIILLVGAGILLKKKNLI